MTQPGARHLLWQLAEQCAKDNQNWFPDVANSLPHHTLALAGEVGEFANLVKKIDRGDKDINDALMKFDLRDELTDVLIYVLSIAGILKVDLLQGYMNKREANVKRFSKGGTNGKRNA